MSVSRQHDTYEAVPHNMLWSRMGDGTFVTENSDAVRWNSEHILQCSATTYPRVVAGETVPGERCKNTMRIGYPKWLIAPGMEVPLVLCWSHAKSDAAREAVIAQTRSER